MKVKQFDVFGMGQHGFVLKTKIEAYNSEEAERIGKRFAIAMGFVFSHVASSYARKGIKKISHNLIKTL